MAQRYNTVVPDARLADNRVSEYESWPFGGTRPSLRYLAGLAATYGHGCTPVQLVDVDDLEQLDQTERGLLTVSRVQGGPLDRVAGGVIPPPGRPEPGHYRHEDAAGHAMHIGAGRIRRRIVSSDARGLPIREEIVVAAEESAQFRRWSAATNVDDDVIEQMEADVADVAQRYLVDPPVAVFARLLSTRDDVFALIAGRQSPRHGMDLYKIGGQLCALLAHASADLGHPHAANSHARTALHCADNAGYAPLRVYTRWVQSNIAYWAGRYDDAAQLVDTAMDDATDGTAVLRLTSQRARIRAAQGDTPRVAAALDLASAASTEPGAGEPGVLAFATGKAAYYASEAHRELGGTAYLDAAVSWARTAVDEFFAGPVLHPQLIAAARIDLARAHLARGEIDAVAEHIEPVIRTGSDQRTVPVTRRMSSLGTVLDAYSAIAPGRIAGLRDSIADFCSDPAIGPAVPDRGAAG